MSLDSKGFHDMSPAGKASGVAASGARVSGVNVFWCKSCLVQKSSGV